MPKTEMISLRLEPEERVQLAELARRADRPVGCDTFSSV